MTDPPGLRCDRAQDLDLLVAERVRLERRRRLHRDEADQLEEMVLEHVARGAGLLVERAAVLDADRLGHGDLHVVDVAPVPERLEDAVAEAEDQQVADRLLAEVVVDAVDLRLAEDLADLAVQPLRGVEVVAERLLDDDPPPAAVVVLVVQPDPAELPDQVRRTATAGWPGRRAGCRGCRAPCRGRRGTWPGGRTRRRRRSRGACSRSAARTCSHASTSSGRTRLNCSSDARISARNDSSVVRPAADGDEHELVRQQVGPPQVVEGRDDLAVGEVAGRPEQDDDRGIRDALEAQAVAQDVLDRLGPRRALALAGEAQLAHRSRRVLGPWRGPGGDRLVGRRDDRRRVLDRRGVRRRAPPSRRLRAGRRHRSAATRS